MFDVVQVPPLSRKRIRERAQEVRDAFKITTPCFPIMEIVEYWLPRVCEPFVLELLSIEDMAARFGSGTHAMTHPDELHMMLREDVYRGAWKDQGRDRFTVAHEMGHLVLHRFVGMARRLRTEVLTFENSEWQADTFAGELLMPLPDVLEHATAQDIATVFKVSLEAARVRLSVLTQEGRR